MQISQIDDEDINNVVNIITIELSNGALFQISEQDGKLLIKEQDGCSFLFAPFLTGERRLLANKKRVGE